MNGCLSTNSGTLFIRQQVCTATVKKENQQDNEEFISSRMKQMLVSPDLDPTYPNVTDLDLPTNTMNAPEWWYLSCRFSGPNAWKLSSMNLILASTRYPSGVGESAQNYYQCVDTLKDSLQFLESSCNMLLSRDFQVFYQLTSLYLVDVYLENIGAIIDLVQSIPHITKLKINLVNYSYKDNEFNQIVKDVSLKERSYLDKVKELEIKYCIHQYSPEGVSLVLDTLERLFTGLKKLKMRGNSNDDNAKKCGQPCVHNPLLSKDFQNVTITSKNSQAMIWCSILVRCMMKVRICWKAISKFNFYQIILMRRNMATLPSSQLFVLRIMIHTIVKTDFLNYWLQVITQFKNWKLPMKHIS